LYKTLAKKIMAGITGLFSLVIGLYVSSVISDATYEATDKIAEQQFADNPQLQSGYDTARAVDDAVSAVEDTKETTLEITKTLTLYGIPAAAFGGFIMKKLR
jgi:hypothetical protein